MGDLAVVWSIDFDGCINNEKFKSKQLSIVDANWRLIRRINASTYDPEFKFLSIMNGSNRQSPDINSMNKYLEGWSVFEQLPQLVNAIPLAHLDTLLLPDALCNLNSGETWRRAVSDNPNLEAPGCLMETNKIMLLYFQIQHAAKQHLKKDGQLEFNFVDDRKDILAALTIYFSMHSGLIPQGVTLVLNHYDGQSFERMKAIKGSGVIDHGFRKSVLAYAKCLDPETNRYFQYELKRSYNGNGVHPSDFLSIAENLSFETFNEDYVNPISLSRTNSFFILSIPDFEIDAYDEENDVPLVSFFSSSSF